MLDLVIMPKQCLVKGCNYNVFSKGYCKSHQYLREDIKKSIPRESKKRAVENRQYSKETRVAFFEKPENKSCKICGKEATDIHHMKGRVGKLLNDMRFMIGLCRSCHSRVEENPEWAISNGYSIQKVN